MKKRRWLVIGVGLIVFCLFAGMLISDIEFLVENDIDHWDFKVLLFLGLTGVGLLLALASVIMNKFFSRHLVVPVFLVILILGVRALPVRWGDYRKVIYPISDSEVERVSRLKLSQDDEHLIYLYRSDNQASIRFMSKMKTYLKTGDQSVYAYDLTKAQAKMTTGQYSALIKRLGVNALPAIVFSYRGFKHSRPYAVTFNAINEQTRFSKLKAYLDGDREKTSGPGIVFKGS
ncbi:hypothetical protein [Levilactobacillus senmaizukei]|nr:hypothetical protein [Levilactobacillus senmaizukei]